MFLNKECNNLRRIIMFNTFPSVNSEPRIIRTLLEDNLEIDN